MEELSFSRAIELLGITDIGTVSGEDLAALAKSARKRWHPDNVLHRNSRDDIERYTRNFQLIEPAIDLVRQFIDGSLHAGPTTANSRRNTPDPPAEEIIRTEAPRILVHLIAIWPQIKVAKFKWSEETVRLSEGYRLRDLLSQDFKDDIAALSIVSFAYGAVVFGLATVLSGAIAPALGVLAGLFWLAQAVSCLVGVLPLSRFWLPANLQSPMLWFVNLGLRVYHFAEREAGWGPNDKLWVQFLVQSPMLLAGLVKYGMLWPSYEIAKLIAGDRLVGVANKTVNYYGGFAEWYVDELLSKAEPRSMSSAELIDLGRLYSELGDFAVSPAATSNAYV